MILFILCNIASLKEENEINIQQQQENLNKIEQRKKDIQKEVDRLKQETVDTEKSLQKIQALLSSAEEELAKTKQTYENILKEVALLEKELNIEQEKLDLQLIILQNRLKKFYKYNDITYLAVLINSRDFSQFLNRYRYLEKILENDADIVRLVKEQVELVKKQKDNLHNKQEITRMLEEEIAKEKENIAVSAEAKNKYLTKIEEERKKQLLVLEELEKSSIQIKEIIEVALKEKEKEREAQLKSEQLHKQKRTDSAKSGPTLQIKRNILFAN